MEREERRRRILSRGNDRIALISGRIQTLDPNPLSESSTFSHTPPDDHVPSSGPQHARSTSDSGAPSANLYEGELPFLQDYHPFSTGRDNVGVLQDTITEESMPSDSQKPQDKEASAQSSTKNQLTPRFSKASNNTEFPEKPFVGRLHSITPKEINFSIISSENTRVICSVVIAVLVVLSHVSLPHNVVKSKSLIAYRPLYVVLMTDVLIVAGRLALFAQRREEDFHHHKGSKLHDDGHNWEGAVKLLEFGLVFHQTLRAIFIDCSFYLVIVICGLSLI